MAKSRSETSETASWDFLEDEWWANAMRGAVRRTVERYDVDAYDLYQDLALWLAVRPEVTCRKPSRRILSFQASHLAQRMLHDEEVSYPPEWEESVDDDE